jgi:hypothetical protein
MRNYIDSVYIKATVEERDSSNGQLIQTTFIDGIGRDEDEAMEVISNVILANQFPPFVWSIVDRERHVRYFKLNDENLMTVFKLFCGNFGPAPMPTFFETFLTDVYVDDESPRQAN